jgi:uncharacterized RDD family membrane protein YckC
MRSGGLPPSRSQSTYYKMTGLGRRLLSIFLATLCLIALAYVAFAFYSILKVFIE